MRKMQAGAPPPHARADSALWPRFTHPRAFLDEQQQQQQREREIREMEKEKERAREMAKYRERSERLVLARPVLVVSGSTQRHSRLVKPA